VGNEANDDDQHGEPGHQAGGGHQEETNTMLRQLRLG
jgi:hypothetical protein